jgi:hypothetical protein
MKIEVFREMYGLNQAFERIIEGLRRLEKVPFLCRELVQDMRTPSRRPSYLQFASLAMMLLREE